MNSGSDDSSEEFYDATSEAADISQTQNVHVEAQRKSPDTFSNTSEFEDHFLHNSLNHNAQTQSEPTRRQRLDVLRDRMRFDVEELELQRTSSVASSDSVSLSSWGKHLLASTNVGPKPVVPFDTMSTRGEQISLASPLLPPIPLIAIPPPSSGSSTGTPPSSGRLTSSIHRSNDSVNKITAQNATIAAQNNSSSGTSSKSSTLDRFASPVLKSRAGSLDRTAIFPPGAVSNTGSGSGQSSKSNSLTRDLSSLSTYDEEELAQMERKNSAAAEIIEEITSEIRSMHEISEGEEEENVTEKENVEPVAALHFNLDQKTFDDSVLMPPPPVPPPRRRKNPHQESTKPSLTAAQTLHEQACRLAASMNLNAQQLAVLNKLTRENALQSGLSDQEILHSVMVKNLDTGEQIPLAEAEERLPQGINPLSLHIMRLAQDFPGEDDIISIDDSEAESNSSAEKDRISLASSSTTVAKEYLASAKARTLQVKRFMSKKVGQSVRKTVNKIKQVKHNIHKNGEEISSEEEADPSEASRTIRIRASHHHKGPYNFEQAKLVQDLSGEHKGAIWCLKFSLCGRLLASGGQDNLVRVWVLKDASQYFIDMRQKYNSEGATLDISLEDVLSQSSGNMSSSRGATPTLASLRSSSMDNSMTDYPSTSSDVSADQSRRTSLNSTTLELMSPAENLDDISAPFVSKPFCCLRAHTADVLDIAWSKNYFMLTSSMDRTVRLWHVTRPECLCCFQHVDFVTAIAFLPKDDRYFLSGSLDGKLRLWNIPEKKVALWNEVAGGKLITAMTFVKNGKFAVIGTYDGRCIFYNTEQLKYFTQIDVKSTRGKNAKGHKITGLEATSDKLLVTSNDSRIRLYDLRDLSLACKYKGCTNYSSQIKASFSHDAKFIVCGSEDKNVFLWKTTFDSLLPSVRRDRNRQWESIRAHNAVVTSAVFAPKPELVFAQIDRAKRLATHSSATDGNTGVNKEKQQTLPLVGDMLVTADFAGVFYVFLNKPKVKTGTSTFLPSYN